jgi:hypothetical protein
MQHPLHTARSHRVKADARRREAQRLRARADQCDRDAEAAEALESAAMKRAEGLPPPPGTEGRT